MTTISNYNLNVFANPTMISAKLPEETIDVSSNNVETTKVPNLNETQSTIYGEYKTDDNSAKTMFFAQLFGESYVEKQEPPALSDAAEDFLDFMDKTPEERMWLMFLGQKGLTEESFEQLSLEEKAKILEEFKLLVEEKVEQTILENVKKTLS